MMFWLLLAAAYLLGSVSFAYLAGRIKNVDLRQHGSGNLGATNAGRVLGKGWGFAVFGCDLGKGLVAVLAARYLVQYHGANANLPILAAAAVLLGHSFTCFHRFKGGKAVATSLGVLIGLVYKVAAITLATWLVVWAVGYSVFRLKPSDAVGPASVIAALVMPIAHLYTFPDPWSIVNLWLTLFLFAVSALVVVKHRTNLARLFAKRRTDSGQGSGTTGVAP